MICYLSDIMSVYLQIEKIKASTIATAPVTSKFLEKSVSSKAGVAQDSPRRDPVTSE